MMVATETVISARCAECREKVWFEPDSDYAYRTVKLCEECEATSIQVTVNLETSAAHRAYPNFLGPWQWPRCSICFYYKGVTTARALELALESCKARCIDFLSIEAKPA